LKLKMRDLVIAAACVAVVVPALAYGDDPPATANVVAQDYGAADGRWDNPNPTIAVGGTVNFSDPGSQLTHNVVFTEKQPASCTQTGGANTGAPPPLPTIAQRTWAGNCRFASAGDYPFVCSVHANMTGTVHVAAAATPTPTATATPVPTTSPGPGGGGNPPGSGGTNPPAAKPKLTLAKSQKGARVRGSVTVAAKGSKLVITVWAPKGALSGGKSKKPVQIGRKTRTNAPAGKVSFAIATNAKAKSALRRHRRLSVTVSVALTPPGGHELTDSAKSTLKMS
jgi:plastocyanin